MSAPLITTHLDAAVPAKESLQQTLQLRILEYASSHLSDPTLNAAQIGAEHHISVRHLYNTPAAAGISLGEWIRTQRLEQCRRELARPSSRTTTIASVAHRWGFPDASSFGRLFRLAFDMSPREWRDLRSTTH